MSEYLSHREPTVGDLIRLSEKSDLIFDLAKITGDYREEPDPLNELGISPLHKDNEFAELILDNGNLLEVARINNRENKPTLVLNHTEYLKSEDGTIKVLERILQINQDALDSQLTDEPIPADAASTRAVFYSLNEKGNVTNKDLEEFSESLEGISVTFDEIVEFEQYLSQLAG